MITTRTFRPLLAAALLAVGVGACSDNGGPEPDPNSGITVALTTPNTDDGAVLLVLQGPTPSAIMASSAGYQLFWRAAGPTETRVIVVGDIVAGRLFTATTSGSASTFTATVAEVSTRADQLRSTTAGYSLVVSD